MSALIVVAACLAYMAVGAVFGTRQVRRIVSEDDMAMDRDDWFALTFCWVGFTIVWPAFLLLAALSVVIRRIVTGGPS